MRAADIEVIQILTTLAVRLPAVMLWLRHDEKRLTETQLERAWFPATRDLAAFMLGSLALAWHYLRTRRSLRGLAYAIAALVVCEGATALLLEGVELCLRGSPATR